MTNATTRPVFLRGQLETACEIHLGATNDGDFYRAWVKPRIARLAAEFKSKPETYHPLIAVHVWEGAVIPAMNTYRRAYGSIGGIDLAEKVALARMLEQKYRQEVFMTMGFEAADAIRDFDCDAELDRSDAER